MDNQKDQELLWDEWWNWPSPPPGFVFLIPAFQQIGARLCGDQWRDELPPQSYYEVPPENLHEASSEDQEAARRFLSEQAEYKLGDRSKTNEEIPRNFGTTEWEEYFISVHSCNQEIDESTERLNHVSKFLSDRIFLEQLSPYLMSVNGGGWHQSSRDDWILPCTDHIRQRIQSARMTPGRPESTDGSHWIFLRQVEIDTTLEWIETNRIAANAVSPNNQISHAAIANERQRTTASMVRRAINIAAEEITRTPLITRAVLLKTIKDQGIPLSWNSFQKDVWPRGRAMAGAPRHGRTGPRPRST